MAQLEQSPETSDFNDKIEWLDFPGKSIKLKETESLVLDDKDNGKYEWKEVPGIKWLLLCEDPSTKKMFLSDWYKILSENFDNIKNISKDGEDIYYVWVNWWKSTLYNNNVRVNLLTNMDDIDYRIIDWQLVTICENNWKKTVKRGDEKLGENCDEAIFKNIEGDSNSWDCIYLAKWWKWKCFIDWKQYWPEIPALNIKSNPRWFISICKCWEDYMIIGDCRKDSDQRPNSTIIYKGKVIYTWLDRAIPNDERQLKSYDEFRLWDRNVVVVKKGNGKEELYDSKLWKIWTEYDAIDLYSGWEDNCDWIDWEYVATEDHLLINAKKNWRNVLVVDGEDYEVLNYNWKFIEEWEFEKGYRIGDDKTKRLESHTRTEKKDVAGDFSIKTILFLKKWEKSYYMWQDYTLHEFKWKYDDVLYARETPNWKTCFIWKKWEKEVFVFDWKVMWKEYDHISWAGLLPWWWVYVQAERNWEKVFILNWTEREEPNSLDEKTVLFKENDSDY